MGTLLQNPLGYLITFTCYGARVHGDEFGSIKKTGIGRSKKIKPNTGLERHERKQMTQPPFFLDEKQAEIVMSSFLKTANFRNWVLLAAEAGYTHVHIVLTGADEHSRVLRDMKSYASRALNSSGFDSNQRKRWTRGGSASYLWNPEQIARAVEYVLKGQKKTLAKYKNHNANIHI